MSQPTRSDSPVVPIIVFFIIVGVTLFALFPRTPQSSTQPAITVEATLPAFPTEPPQPPVAANPTAVPAATTVETTEIASVEFDPAAAYTWACSGCHGADGTGVENFGPSLLFSSAVVSRDTAALVAMFNVAQPPTDPAEGFVHPYRGGYPEMTDEQLSQLMEYLFTIISSG